MAFRAVWVKMQPRGRVSIRISPLRHTPDCGLISDSICAGDMTHLLVPNPSAGRPPETMNATLKPDLPHPANATARKRILVVDDHAVVRKGLAALIAEEPDLAVCGEAGSA